MKKVTFFQNQHLRASNHRRMFPTHITKAMVDKIELLIQNADFRLKKCKAALQQIDTEFNFDKMK